MARTITEIYNSLVVEKQTLASLDELSGEGTSSFAANLLAELDSRSRVAIWRLILYVVAVCAWTIENLMDGHKSEVSALAAASIAGTTSWLVQQVKLFELGNATLTVSTDRRVIYAVSNPANRIITYAAAAREFGRTVLKVAKDAGGLPSPLTGPELSQVATYVSRIQFAGTRLAVVSRAADKLKISGDIYYDGLLDPDQVLADIETAVAGHLAAVPFDTAISLERLTDVIQSVTGVKDLVVTFYGRPDTSPTYGAVLSGPSWLPFAGYATIDLLDLNPITS